MFHFSYFWQSRCYTGVIARVDTRVNSSSGSNIYEELLLLLGEELKNPLINIAHLSELNGKGAIIRAQAQRALNTIDNVLLYKRFASGQTELHPEPVHVGSAIAEVAAAVEPQMRMSSSHTELDIQHALQTADIDRRLLSGALLSLWQAFINSMQEPKNVVCSAQRISSGIRLSISSEGINLDDFTLSATNVSSSQPVTGIAGSATDLITAQNMFQLAGAQLAKTRLKNRAGLGVTLRPSSQMQLV